MSYFEHYTTTLHARVRSVVATDAKGGTLPIQNALDTWRQQSEASQRQGNVHYFIGNGASATMASHMALDCSKNAGIRALAFNDAASLTAIGNDLGFEQCFAAPLRWHGRPGDLLIAISSSGASPNILAGIKAAAEAGLGIVTLTGIREENPARRMGNLNFYVPAQTYGMVECIHQILLHCWLDAYMGLREWDGVKSVGVPSGGGGPQKS